MKRPLKNSPGGCVMSLITLGHKKCVKGLLKKVHGHWCMSLISIRLKKCVIRQLRNTHGYWSMFLIILKNQKWKQLKKIHTGLAKNAGPKSLNKRRVNAYCLASITLVGLVRSWRWKRQKNCGYKYRLFVPDDQIQKNFWPQNLNDSRG